VTFSRTQSGCPRYATSASSPLPHATPDPSRTQTRRWPGRAALAYELGSTPAALTDDIDWLFRTASRDLALDADLPVFNAARTSDKTKRVTLALVRKRGGWRMMVLG
jgi:hypothetical protein